MTVAIVGAGVSGLAVACAMALRGHQVQVFEKAPEITEIGAGLQISPNGWKVLQALGVTNALTPAVFEPPEIALRLGRADRPVWSLPMGSAARERWGAPYVLVHRADLVGALLKRLLDLAPDAVVTDATVAGYGTRLVLQDGQTVATRLIIGADGLHSAIRSRMLGPEKPRYTGNLAWRALVPSESLGAEMPPANVTIWAGRGRHAVTTRVKAGKVVNFVGMVETPEPGPEDWRGVGQVKEVLPLFADWAAPIRKIIESAKVLNKWALFERKPLTRWSDDRAILIGDAAHPMLPSLAQGAVQGLEDAWVLAALWSQQQDVAQVGQALYAERISRTARIQKTAAENAKMFHRASPVIGPIYYGGMAAVTRMAPRVMLNRQDWVYSHDVVARYPLP